MLHPSEWIHFGLVMFSVCTSHTCLSGAAVDSTVSEPEQGGQPTLTPGQSLRLLHLSGQGTLVQESLSQWVATLSGTGSVARVYRTSPIIHIFLVFVLRSSIEFVAPSQNSFTNTPFIVPSSPTGQENENSEFLEPFSVFTAEQPMKFMCFNRHWWTNGYLAAPRRESEGKGRTNGHRDHLQAPTVCLHSCIPEFPLFHIGENPLCALPAWVFSGMYLFSFFLF